MAFVICNAFETYFRALEASLLEKSGTKRKRQAGDIWFVDPLNPHERKRKSGRSQNPHANVNLISDIY